MACSRLVITVISFSVAAGFTIVPQPQANEPTSNCLVCQRKVYCERSPEETCLDMVPCSPLQQQSCMTRNEEECDDVGVFEDPYIDTRYYKCVVNEADGTVRKVFENCPLGTQFIPWMMRCMNIEEIGIMETMWQDQLQRGPYICRKPGTFTNFRTCKTFYTCTSAGAKAEKHTCPWGSFYNYHEGKCTRYLSGDCVERFIRKSILLSTIAEARDWDLNQYMLDIQNYHIDFDDSYDSYDHGLGELPSDYYNLNDYVLGGTGRKKSQSENRKEDSGLKVKKLKRVFFGFDTKDTLYDLFEFENDEDLLLDYLSSVVDLIPHGVSDKQPLDPQTSSTKGNQETKSSSSAAVSTTVSLINTSTQDSNTKTENIDIRGESSTTSSSATPTKNSNTSIEHTGNNPSSNGIANAPNADSINSEEGNASSIWKSTLPPEINVMPVEGLLLVPQKSHPAEPLQISNTHGRPKRPIQLFNHDLSLPSMKQVLDASFNNAGQTPLKTPIQEEYSKAKIHNTKDLVFNGNPMGGPVITSEAFPNKDVHYNDYGPNMISRPIFEPGKNPIVDVTGDHMNKPTALGNLDTIVEANLNPEGDTIKIVETNIYPNNNSVKIVKTSVNPVNNKVKIVETNVFRNNARSCVYPCSKVPPSRMRRARNFHCTEPGNFRDPLNCHKFFLCIEDYNPYDEGGFRIKHMTCGDEYFNEEKQACEDQKPEDCSQ